MGVSSQEDSISSNPSENPFFLKVQVCQHQHHRIKEFKILDFRNSHGYSNIVKIGATGRLEPCVNYIDYMNLWTIVTSQGRLLSVSRGFCRPFSWKGDGFNFKYFWRLAGLFTRTRENIWYFSACKYLSLIERDFLKAVNMISEDFKERVLTKSHVD